MSTSDYIVKDSSIYQDSGAYALEYGTDATIKLGVVRDIMQVKDNDIAYIVEVWLGGKYTPVKCSRSSRFGGIYNYEEYTLRGFEPDNSNASDGLLDYKPGDQVIIAYLMGDSREGVILTSINHSGRERLFKIDDDVMYESEFNGLNKSINMKGEYTVTYKGIQTNIDKLNSPANGKPLEAPAYNTAVSGSYYKFAADGSFSISDNKEQTILIDKSGKIVITSGGTSMTIDKAAESYTIMNKMTTFNSTDKFMVKTKEAIIKADKLVDIKATDIKTDGELAQKGNVMIKGNIMQTGNNVITGGLTTTGPTALAGGAQFLVWDIALTIGVGNLGAPVVSSHLLLKTVLTKAT